MSDTIDYPYYKSVETIDKEKFREMILHFKYNVKRHYNGEYDRRKLYILEDWTKHDRINKITDLFTEECRAMCNFYGYDAPYNYWQKNKKELLAITTNPIKLRELLYKKTKLCNNFRITVAMTILKLYNAKSWLDISAGWGDRLIAAIACNVEYFSTDPNYCLKDKYTDIINTLADDATKYIVRDDGFETVQLPFNKRFDICFTSPPFYDLETYSDDPDDSITKYKDGNEWYKKFLIYSVKKAINCLAINGHLILYITDAKNTSYINNMLVDINKLLKYKGIVYYYYPENLSPTLRGLYVWKKVYDENPNFIIKTINNIDIIDETILIGGTKQRAVISIIRKLSEKYDIFVMDINSNYNDGITLAYSCSLFNKKAYLVADIDKIDIVIKDKIEKYGGIFILSYNMNPSKGINILSYNMNLSKGIFNMSFDKLDKVYRFDSGFGNTFVKSLEKKIRFTLGTTFVKDWNKYDEVWCNSDLGNVLSNIYKSTIIKEDKEEDIWNHIQKESNNKKILFWTQYYNVS